MKPDAKNDRDERQRVRAEDETDACEQDCPQELNTACSVLTIDREAGTGRKVSSYGKLIKCIIAHESPFEAKAREEWHEQLHERKDAEPNEDECGKAVWICERQADSIDFHERYRSWGRPFPIGKQKEPRALQQESFALFLCWP